MCGSCRLCLRVVDHHGANRQALTSVGRRSERAQAFFREHPFEMTSNSELNQFFDENDSRIQGELFEFLRIPSVSAKSEHNKDVRLAAEWLRDSVEKAGLKATIYETPGHPVVIGEWRGAPGAPTILVYGHYDVQPAEPLDLWTSPPFEPTVRDGNIYARGSVDDKGQLFLHVKALEAHMKTRGKLPVNVVLIAEGEEEVGSDNLEEFVEKQKELLACEGVVISDSAMFAPGQPCILSSLRGQGPEEHRPPRLSAAHVVPVQKTCHKAWSPPRTNTCPTEPGPGDATSGAEVATKPMRPHPPHPFERSHDFIQIAESPPMHATLTQSASARWPPTARWCTCRRGLSLAHDPPLRSRCHTAAVGPEHEQLRVGPDAGRRRVGVAARVTPSTVLHGTETTLAPCHVRWFMICPQLRENTSSAVGVRRTHAPHPEPRLVAALHSGAGLIRPRRPPSPDRDRTAGRRHRT